VTTVDELPDQVFIDTGQFIDWIESWSKDRTDPEWLYDDVLARGRGHALFAPAGTKKSLFTLWIAATPRHQWSRNHCHQRGFSLWPENCSPTATHLAGTQRNRSGRLPAESLVFTDWPVMSRTCGDGSDETEDLVGCVAPWRFESSFRHHKNPHREDRTLSVARYVRDGSRDLSCHQASRTTAPNPPRPASLAGPRMGSARRSSPPGVVPRPA
jgi:hypothetical protein